MSASMRPLPRLEPVQQDLPLPAPPWRPFFALAREIPIGNPTSKFVYMMVASYCPVMARAWSAVGRVRRKTLQRVCEFKKIETLDLHLRALRTAGYADWSRTGRASEFTLRLSPLHILGLEGQPALASGGEAVDPSPAADPPFHGGSADPSRGSDPPSNGGSRHPGLPPNGGSGAASVADPPFHRGSAPLFGDSESPRDGGSPPPVGAARSPENGGSVSPSRGGFRSPVSRRGVVVRGSQGSPVAAAAAAEHLGVVRPGLDHRRASTGASAPGPPAAGLLDRQIKLLEVASDRLRAEPRHDLWRAAEAGGLQRQLSAAVRYRERLEWVPHTHDADGEVLCEYGDLAGIPWMTVVQRCACGSVRVVRKDRSAGLYELVGWSLCGLVAAYAADTAFLGDLSGAPPSAAFVVSLAEWEPPYSLADVAALAESGGVPPALVAPSASGSPSAESGVECPSCGAFVASVELTDAGCVVCGAVGDPAPAAVDIVSGRASGRSR